jgi:hypothetical protein
MHPIDSKNKVMAEAWNCQKRYGTADPQIARENRVPVDLEIVNEYRVTADICNQQRQLILNRRIKPIAKIELWLTYGIVKNAMSLLIHKSSVKTEYLLMLKSSMNTE